MTIWNGEQDRGNVEGGKWLASRVPGAEHRVIPDKGHLVGFDVVEVNPYRDPSGRTAQTAIRVLIDTLGSAFH